MSDPSLVAESGVERPNPSSMITDPTTGKDPDAIKLFIGQVPRSMGETDIRPMFEQIGELYDLMIIRDKITGAHRGCAFVTYKKKEDAERCCEQFHGKKTLQPNVNTLQVKPAEGQPAAPPQPECKLFIGMLPVAYEESHITELFKAYGTCSMHSTKYLLCPFTNRRDRRNFHSANAHRCQQRLRFSQVHHHGIRRGGNRGTQQKTHMPGRSEGF